MANNPSTLPDYNGQINAPDAEYPYGSARDDVTPGDLTGTPRVAAELKDLQGFQQALLTEAGVIPSGTPDKVGDSQYLEALVAILKARLATATSFTFATVADMQAGATFGGLSVTLKAGDRIEIEEIANGYFEVKTGETPNGSTIIDTTTGLQAVLLSTDKNTLTVTGSTADEVQAAIRLAYEDDSIQVLQFERKTYELNAAIFFNSYPGVAGALDRGLTVVATGAIFKLTAVTPGGAVINFGRGADVGNGDAIERTGNLVWFGGTIDGNNIAGENGWSFARAENMTFHGIRSINCKRDYVGTREGGRGLTGHDRCRNVNVYGYSAFNCSDYYHILHLPDYSAADSGNVAITAITQAAQAQVTAPGHIYQVGDFAAIYNASGMTEINPTYSNEAFYEVLSVSGDNFTIDLDTTTFTPYTTDGRTVIADLTDGGRSSSVNVFGGYAEECEYSLIHVEGGNQPRVSRFIQTVNVLGVVAKNCGTTSTRGLINGVNAIRLNADVTTYNEEGFAPTSLIRGSFQGSAIKVNADVRALQSLVDARPTEENPVGTGIDAGIASHPYGTSADNDYQITVKYRSDVQSGIVSYIRTDDNPGSAIDQFYRNHVDIVFTGLSDGVGAGSDFSNNPLHNTNTVCIKDPNIGRKYEGSLTTVRSFTLQANTVEHGGYEHNFDTQINVNEVAGGFARYGFQDAAKSEQGAVEYTFGNDRIIYRLDGNTNNYQMSNVAIFPSFDNLRDLGTAGLRMRTIYAGTGAINTSDEDEKTELLAYEGAEKAAALEIKGAIRKFKFKESLEEKGDDARVHFGVGAQTVKAILERHGLEPFDYAFLCFDEWDDMYDEQPVYDAQGEAVSVERVLIKKAGSRYGVRYEELLCFIVGAI